MKNSCPFLYEKIKLRNAVLWQIIRVRKLNWAMMLHTFENGVKTSRKRH